MQQNNYHLGVQHTGKACKHTAVHHILLIRIHTLIQPLFTSFDLYLYSFFQENVSSVLGVPRHKISCSVKRIGKFGLNTTDLSKCDF